MRSVGPARQEVNFAQRAGRLCSRSVARGLGGVVWETVGWFGHDLASVCEDCRMADRYEFPEGHHLVKLFPVEGDSAIAELWFGEAPWAQIWLTGINLDAVGDERVRDVEFRGSLFPPPAAADPGWWEFELSDVEDRLSAAKDWLRDNERHRVPLDSDEGITAAGSAMSKAAETTD